MNDDDRWAGSGAGFGSDRNVSSSLVGIVRGHDVQVSGSATALAAANGTLFLEHGGCGVVVANGPASIRFGGCGPLVANGDVSIEYGGAQTVLAAGGADIRSGGFVGLLASPRVTVEGGGRVLLGTRQAIAFGAAAGVAFALLSRLLRR